MKNYIYLAFCILLSPISQFVLAGEDHLSPRFVLESKQFEAVGVVQEKILRIYIDEVQTNTPVDTNKIVLTLDGKIIPLEKHDLGEFIARIPESMDQEQMKVVISLTALNRTEQLSGDLVLHDDNEHAEHAPSISIDWLAYVLLAMLVTLICAVWFKHRNHKVRV